MHGIISVEMNKNQKIVISKTNESPGFVIDWGTGIIEITGKSTLENPVQFFKKILANLTDYFENPRPFTTINFRLDYVNTASSKWVFYILKNIESKHQKKTWVEINWFYESDDESIQEAGEVYKTLVKAPFNLFPEEF